MRNTLFVTLLCSIVIGVSPTGAQAPRSDYRVVFASATQLSRQLDEVGRDGYACTTVAHGDAAVALPGVVVALGRPVGGPVDPVMHRVIIAPGSGVDLAAPLQQAGAEGFRLCGLVLDEEPPRPRLVAVMVRQGSAPPARFIVEPLQNYKASLVRLNQAAQDGLVPVAAAPIDNNRVREMRSWLVVGEHAGGRVAARQVAVRSNSGADGLQRALNEQGGQGYRIDALWKEGQDAVAMMSRAAGDTSAHSYAVDVTSLARIHSVSHLYLADVPYLSGDDRLIVSDRAISATNDLEEDALPPLNGIGYAEPGKMGVIGDHISRHHGSAPLSMRIRRGPRNELILATVVTERTP